jgi:hypothetical protein
MAEARIERPLAPEAYALALLFVRSRIGFIRRRLNFGALGFAQRSFLVSLSLFFLAPSTCRPCSVGSISSVVWLKCHHVPRWLVTHLSGAHGPPRQSVSLKLQPKMAKTEWRLKGALRCCASCGASFREKLFDVSRRFSNSALSL